MGTATAGAINNAAFLALTSEQALRRTIIAGRPDLGMPPFDRVRKSDQPRAPLNPLANPFKPLTNAEVTDLEALLAYWKVGGN
jgi:hypothetical protein